MAERPHVYTVGHSTRSADELVALLREAQVATLADVRRFPGSRRHPQHGRAALECTLREADIAYAWLGETLGGRIAQVLAPEESPNRAWSVAAFRNYADAMRLPSFQRGLSALESLARERPTVVMCAERLWWRCHRRLLADLLSVRDFQVVHLMDRGRSSDHALTEWARVDGGILTYPALL